MRTYAGPIACLIVVVFCAGWVIADAQGEWFAPTVESVTLMGDGTLEVVEVQPLLRLSDGDPPRRYIKQVCGAVSGRVVLVKTIEGRLVPAQVEHVEWPR